MQEKSDKIEKQISANEVYDQLKQTFFSSKSRSIKFRKTQLKNLLNGISQLHNKFYESMKQDLGASHFQTDQCHIYPTVGAIEDTLENLEDWAKPRPTDTIMTCTPCQSYLYPEPYGVVLVISAWNYPISLSLVPLAQAIAAGNCVLVKPHRTSPKTAEVIKTLIENYLDKSCYRVYDGPSQEITSKPFDLVMFTGSPTVGKQIYQAAASNLTPCLLELGGKNPVIIDEDININHAVKYVVQGKFVNVGQTCIATEHLLIHKKIAKPFVQELIKEIEKNYGKDAKLSEEYGRIISKQATERLVSYLAEPHQGQVIYGGKFSVDERYMEPTIVESPSLNCKMMKEEIFGPILPIFYWDDFDAIIKDLQKKEKPLSLYYFGHNSNHMQRLQNETSSGSFMVNEVLMQFVNHKMPFGGVGHSGMGAYHGKNGFDYCSHLKPVMKKYHLEMFPFTCRFGPFNQFKKETILFLQKHFNFTQSQVVRGLVLTMGVVAVYEMYKYKTLSNLIGLI